MSLLGPALALLLAQTQWISAGMEIQDEGVRQGYAIRVNCTGPVACTRVGNSWVLAVEASASGAPTDAPYVTMGAVAGLSAEVAVPTCTGSDVLTSNGTALSCVSAGAGGGAPTTTPYWTGAADAGLSAEHNLGALGTGLVLNTAGTPSAYGGTGAAPANQWLTALSASGVGTWVRPALTNLANPTGDWTATFPTGTKALWTFTGSTDEAFTIHGDGAFTGTGDLVHINKTGTGASATSDALHVEVTDDTNMRGINIEMVNGTRTALTTNALITAAGFSGPLTGSVTGNAGTATALAADPANCGAGQAPLGILASGAVEGCFTPAGTYTLPDAAAGTTGGVRLTGDLGGTAASPAVVDDSHAHTTTTISALDAGDVTTGTLVGARGGGGSALPTCGGTDKLTANGTTWSCATDVGGTYTLPAAAASVLGGVRGTGALLVCSGTDKVTGFDGTGTLQCATDQTGGAGSVDLRGLVTAFGGF